MKTRPYGIPQPPKGYIYYGKGPVKNHNYSHSEDIAGTCPELPHWGTGCMGNTPENYYAIRAGTELARLNGLEDGWQKVSEVGWPKDEDYPVWVWHPEKKLGWSNQPEGGVPFTWELETIKIFPLNGQQDEEITHWQRCPITKPEPPVEENSEAQDRIEAAERKLEEAKLDLERARKALK